MTNVYFKKENDIILNGTLCKEVESKFMLCASLANHQKHSASVTLGGALLLIVLSALSLLWSAPTPTGVPPSGLFIVESVFSCFIMKNKFAKVY